MVLVGEVDVSGAKGAEYALDKGECFIRSAVFDENLDGCIESPCGGCGRDERYKRLAHGGYRRAMQGMARDDLNILREMFFKGGFFWSLYGCLTGDDCPEFGRCRQRSELGERERRNKMN